MFHKVFVKTTKKDANRFLCLQALMGDAGDGIPGLPKCGIKTAEKYLASLKKPTLDDVIQIYKDKGFPKEDAITQIRLVHMGQVEKINKKGKIKVRLYS
jgi:5'-3' exonuclease